MDAPAFLNPLIELLPEDAQRFMNSGGWLVVAGLVGLIVLVILASIFRRMFTGRGRRAEKRESILTEDLATYPPPPPLWGEKRLTVHGLAARVRLIVAAPLGYEASAVMPNEIEALVNYVVPGLGHMVRADKPRIRVWETQLSYQGFTAAFRRHTLVPDMDHQVSRWVLVMGKTLIDRKPYALGLALLADQDNTLNRITLEQPHQWMEALRVKQ